MSYIKSIETRLREQLAPSSLEIINESHLHAGHQPGFDGQGETHLRIRISTPRFDDKSRVERHRIINDLISAELQAGLHAVAIEAHGSVVPDRPR